MFTRNEEMDPLELADDVHPEFVPVIFAKDRAEAEDYRCLLEAQDIPTLVGADGVRATACLDRAVPVLVADAWHDQASGIVASAERDALRADYGDDEEDEDEFEDDDDDDEDDDLDDLDEDFDDDEDELDEDFDDEE
ncbi:MAG TPA: hypothetical protein VGM03_24525 [Phycisphaerae bacterium]|jgi:hypothetical protein